MTADDEFRKVAEDLRGLARALKSELGAARHEARSAARDARRAWRWDAWQGYDPHRPSPPPRWWENQGDAPTTPPATGEVPPPQGPPWHRAPGWAMPWPARPPVWAPPHPRQRATTAVAPAPPPPPPAPPAPPVRHRRDGSTLISLLLVLVGLAWLGSASGVVSLSLETVLAAVLVVLGAAMVVTARTDWSLSRRHWPVWLGIGVLLLVIASAGQDGLSRLHFGPTTVSPSASDLATPVTNFAGPIRVNLPPTLPGKGAALRVRDVFGPVSVVIPGNANYQVRVDARSRFGPVNVTGADRGSGMFSHKTATIGSSGPTLTLDVTDVFGPVSVSQGA